MFRLCQLYRSYSVNAPCAYMCPYPAQECNISFLENSEPLLIKKVVEKVNGQNNGNWAVLSIPGLLK